MDNEGLEKSLNKFDNDLNDAVNRVGGTPLEMKQSAEAISNQIPEESKGYNFKGFLKWLFTEFF